MDDFWEIMCPLSNHVLTNDLGRPIKVISATLNHQSTAKTAIIYYKYTAYVASLSTAERSAKCL